MTVPCLRPDDLTFEYETPIVLENDDGTEDRYECRIEFDVAPDDAIYIRQVDVWGVTRWQNCRHVECRAVADALHERAENMADELFDTFSVEIEDRRAEQEKEAWLDAREMEIDNADALGHARREKLAEGRM